ncbi:peptidase C39 family protein [Verrucomicrobia bacterium]|nr:peptidase C39 family protein [Verrucomicrobiota bacterium]MDA7665660.1 peptidase C39 family protein [Verrucomicrobiota bacterium]
MGRWADGRQSLDLAGLRTSMNDQKNDCGVVYTDTLVFKKPPTDCEVELSLYPGNDSKGGTLDFFGVCLSPPPAFDKLLRPSPILETRLIDVPLLCQRDYIGGGVWCSPTSVTMIMHYWSKKLARPDLRYSVLETANLVYDPGWPGTGNWAFNVAFAGGHLNMRAHVNRLNAIDELRSLIGAGVPVAASVSYDLLKGKSVKGNNDGHLVVVVGFDQSGDPMINDPAACPEVRRTYPLEHFIKAWQSSRQTVYIIYPSKIGLPDKLEIHWQ